MEKLLAVLGILVGIAFVVLASPDGTIAVLFVGLLSIPIIFLLRYYSGGNKFVVQVFFAALVVRLAFGLLVYYFKQTEFFAGDAVTYDFLGQRLVEVWHGTADLRSGFTQRAMATSGPGWGMNYLVGAIYYIFGQSLLVAQSFCAVVGAATAPMVYFCSEKLFHNQRVAKTAAVCIALFPSFIIWSSQLMKDGLIIFLLVVTMTLVVHLQKKFSYLAVFILIFSLFGIIALRFYIFYLVIIAIVGSFLVGFGSSAKEIGRNIFVMAILGLSLTYLGVLQNATQGLDAYGSLEQIQNSRMDLATTANTGFGKDVDVSTTEGALSAIPLGFAYLMLAPFPWEMANIRQAITLPEVLAWWALIPIMIYGLWYTIKNRLRDSIAILIFSLMLTLSYSVFQGNVGTAYRQRTQIQVFLFIFIAVGWSLIQERRENKKALLQAQKQRQIVRIQQMRT
ncbi:MAG: glycosyltransferase family 39 protein [Acidobacteria bacterium]|nr:glycosyltransferase family 39 protein [Acidobacteriota bacterium]